MTPEQRAIENRRAFSLAISRPLDTGIVDGFDGSRTRGLWFSKQVPFPGDYQGSFQLLTEGLTEWWPQETAEAFAAEWSEARAS